MEQQKVLMALLAIHRSNFQILHWKASGEDFDTMHAKMNEYYGMLSGDLDDVAEMIIRQGENPLNYIECTHVLNEYNDLDVKILMGTDDYDREDIVEFTNVFLSDIISVIEAVLSSDEMKDSKNVGIRAHYESMHDAYDKQCRYLNRRRG